MAMLQAPSSESDSDDNLTDFGHSVVSCGLNYWLGQLQRDMDVELMKKTSL